MKTAFRKKLERAFELLIGFSPVLLLAIYFLFSPIPGTDTKAAKRVASDDVIVDPYQEYANGEEPASFSSLDDGSLVPGEGAPRGANAPIPPREPPKKSGDEARMPTPALPNPLCPPAPGPAKGEVSPLSASARGIPVLVYHGEGDGAEDTPLPVFIDHMCALKNAGWRTVTVKEYLDFLKGVTRLPDRSFLLTFDDGRKDTYYPVDPVLKELGFTAVMYVITGFSLPQGTTPPGTRFYLSEVELENMHRSGRWELESHGDQDHYRYQIATTTKDGAPTTTVGYFLSNLFTVPNAGRLETTEEFRARIAGDLAKSKQLLEQRFGREVATYAYPFNEYGLDTINFPDARRIIAEVVPKIYAVAFYQHWAGNGDMFNYPGMSGFMQKRIEPGISWSGARLLAELEGGRPKDLPYRTESFGADWMRVWGSAAPEGGTLSLSARPETTGANALLNGTGSWEDYRLNATFDWRSGSEITLHARASDSYNSISCTFSENLVTLEKRVNGARQKIVTISYAFADSRTDADFSIEVDGDAAHCFAADVPVVGARIDDPVLRKGGIGIQVWDPAPGKAQIIVKRVAAEPR